MAAPYWGQLPPPQVVRTNSMKREGKPNLPPNLTIDAAGDLRQPPNPAQPRSRSSRYSTQTVQTDAPTISTQSPFASPTASSFRGDGLAPRPSSFPYGASNPAYNKDYLEKRRRRESRNREQSSDNPTSAPLPAAPDPPQPPPSRSYKQTYSNGVPSSSNQSPVRSRAAQRSEGPVSSSRDVPDSYSRSGQRGQYSVDERQSTARRSSKGTAVARNGAAERSHDHPERPDTLQSQPRKDSASEAEAQRHREWAPDRSPLQRLELTLDSITKEEKRARVEEAELIAREAKAGRGGERANQNSVRFRNRPVAKASPMSASQPEPQSLSEAGLVRSISSRQRDQLQRSGTVETKRPVQPDVLPASTARGFDYQPRKDVSEDVITDARKSEQTSIPQRVPSVRDRSALPVVAAVAGAVGAEGLSRSGSNKLKKDPPGDPWFTQRVDAEKKSQQFVPRRPSGSDRQQAITATAGPSRGVATDKELPSIPKVAAGKPEYPIDHNFDDEMDQKPVRRGSARKIEQITGLKVAAQAPRSIPPSRQQIYTNRPGNPELGNAQTRRPEKEVRTELVTVNGIKYGVPPAVGDANSKAPSQGSHSHHHFSDILHHGRHENVPGAGVYVPSRRLDEWKKGGVVLLAGELLDLDVNDQTEAEQDKAWWEAGHSGKRRRSATKQRKAEAYDGEYDDTNAPTRFKPPLFLKSGPFLRYCGLRNETLQGHSARNASAPRREIWRGSVMIVTEDAKSSYELAPTLRLFLQPITLLPPPPAQVDGEIDELAPEYVDPIAGLPKIGRDGRTLYIRPVEQLDEEKDLSREESDAGLFETIRSPLDGAVDPKRAAYQKSHYDGEKAGKYKEIRGFRLHTEHGVTFWKFNIEVELRDKQQRVAYRINRGPATGFWVPARDQAMNIMFHSCNGFSLAADPNAFSGPDPMWRDVLNTHQTQPFHVMLGGGDQIYNDAIMEQTTIFKEWTEIKDPHRKEQVPFSPELQQELEAFYLNRYCMWFSQGLFGLAISQIPMINVFDDHDIIDGYGSYPDTYMRSPVMSGLGAVAFKYYMLFQHQSSIDEGEDTESSWILGTQPGPYIPELSRSVFTYLGRSIAFLGLDCRTERMNDEIVSVETYDKVFARLEKDIIKGQTKHLIVLLGIPIAYPRMVWLENILTSRIMDPVKALGRAGLLGKSLLNHFDGGVEILDDLDDHWTAKHHKDERNWFVQELQHLAAEKSVRITILGGDVHLAAIGQFYSNPKLNIPKDRDHRYMPNVISSAIVNAPPPDGLADLLNKRNKVHHLDADTDEDMIPIFTHDVTGKPRNNKRLLNRRNWCSIRVYNPDLDPRPSADELSYDGTLTPPPRRGLLRRLSRSRGPSYRPDAAPPLSSAGFFARRASMDRRGSIDSERPGVLTRTLSLTRREFMPTNLFRRNSRRKADDGGINGYGASSEEDLSQDDLQNARSGLRGGGGDEEGYFPTMTPITGREPNHPVENAPTSIAGSNPQQSMVRSQFHRTPTGLSEKQRRKGGALEINLEGGLDICLNIEVSNKDPAGITTPYRLLVPALWYNEVEEGEAAMKVAGGLKRWISFAKRTKGKGTGQRFANFVDDEEV